MSGGVELELLRLRLLQAGTGTVSLREFQEWFVPAFWDDTAAGPQAREIARQAELTIAEYTSGHRPLEETLAMLREMAA